jgi:hypothetical protein
MDSIRLVTGTESRKGNKEVIEERKRRILKPNYWSEAPKGTKQRRK